MIVRYLVLASALTVVSCNSEQPTERKLHDEINGVDFLVQHVTGPALSQSEDKVFLIRGNKKEVIFEGYGAPSLSLRSTAKGVLIIAYCGGAIQSTKSFLAGNEASGEAIAVKVQRFITSGIEVDGKAVCTASGPVKPSAPLVKQP